MKRIFFIAAILFFTSVLYAQKDTTFYKHEVRASFGESILTSFEIDGDIIYNITIAYFYRPVKWFWIGGNIVNHLGSRIYYECREYFPDNSYRDFTKSKIKYAAAIAPEIRFSYLNKPSVILYGALSAGIILEDGYDSKKVKYPQMHPYVHITYFGISGNFGEDKNIFLGGEFGIGFKSFLSIHGGYRF